MGAMLVGSRRLKQKAEVWSLDIAKGGARAGHTR